MLGAFIGSIFIGLVLIAVPVILGIPWIPKGVIDSRIINGLYSYVMGFFVMLAVFELICFPGAILGVSFRALSVIYSIIIISLIVAMVIYIRKKELLPVLIKIEEPKWTKRDFLYLVVFILFLLLQLFYAIFYSRTIMADDGYAAFSSAAIADGYINLTSFYSGLFIPRDSEWIKRVIQGYNFFPGYLSIISGIKPAVIAHTFIYVWIDILAYSTYSVIAYQVSEKRENRLLFMIFVAILYIWGYHSPYSMTFRLLGPNNEGKAILAVVLAPFILSIMYHVIKVGYLNRIGFQLLVISIAACSLSLGGVYTMAAVLVAMVIVSSIINKNIKVLLYLLWGGIVPFIFAGLFLYYRFRWG